MSLELRGFKQREIAQVLSITEMTVHNITMSPHYQQELRKKLDSVDDEFLRMKPKALRALDNGLCSADEGIGLRAAEMWFKGMGYRGFSRDGGNGDGGRVTAEDIATQLLSRGGGSITISATPAQYPATIDATEAQGQDDKS